MEGYFDSATQAADAWGRDATVIRNLCWDGLLPGARKDGRDWKIPFETENAVQAYKRNKLSISSDEAAGRRELTAGSSHPCSRRSDEHHSS